MSLLSQPGNALAWRTPTFGTLLRDVLLSLTGQLASWPGFAIFALTLGGLCAWLTKSKVRIDWDASMPILLALSLVTAPYSWSTDHCILLPIQCAALVISRESSAAAFRRTLSLLGAIQLGQIFLYVLIPEEYSVIFPLLFAFVWWSTDREVHARDCSTASK